MKVLNLEQLMREYDRHIVRILTKVNKTKQFTHAARLGIAYYGNSASAVQKLFDQPWNPNATPGFNMRTAAELAPEKIGFNITEKNNEH